MYSFTMVCFLLMLKARGARRLVGAIFLSVTLPGVVFAAEAPSTFGSTIGQALLCADHVDPFYFWSYLNQFFGPPYKTEGGAHWFKVSGTLWGANITDVLVSDGSNEQVFVAASFKDNPTKLAEAIALTTGISHSNEDSLQYSPLVSNLGSKIVYFGQNSKIYCSKYNLDYSRSHLH